jgi:hypothetical protein
MRNCKDLFSKLSLSRVRITPVEVPPKITLILSSVGEDWLGYSLLCSGCKSFLKN